MPWYVGVFSSACLIFPEQHGVLLLWEAEDKVVLCYNCANQGGWTHPKGSVIFQH